MTGIPALQKAIIALGSQAALAEKLGVGQTAISNWINKTKRVPAERVLALEAISGISRHDLRPDLYPRERRSAQRASA
jgi:DNA-binding transcriptional regulator YdaS (Cro superfamily)